MPSRQGANNTLAHARTHADDAKAEQSNSSTHAHSCAAASLVPILGAPYQYFAKFLHRCVCASIHSQYNTQLDSVSHNLDIHTLTVSFYLHQWLELRATVLPIPT